ncbi:MAG: WYL domain-containing protein [Ferruginibacter sp.]
MPINKAARFRFEIIDECLRNRLHKWSKKKLLDVVNEKLLASYGSASSISLSQIRYDLESMQAEYGAPIENKRDGASVIYYYEDPEFSIIKLPLQEEDITRLKETVHLMQQIKGFTIADEIAEIIQRLENKIKLSTDDKKSVIAFENPPTALGSDNLGDIYESIINKRVLKISYRHFYANEAAELVIHPYFLKEFNNRWFLFGWSDKNNRVENMALDRMQVIKITSEKYNENETFDAEAYFTNIIGVTNVAGASVEGIELLFTKDRAPYIITKKLHHSQQTLKTYKDGRCLIKISLIINKELKSLILGFGDNVEVKEPKAFRMEIKSILEKAIVQY